MGEIPAWRPRKAGGMEIGFYESASWVALNGPGRQAAWKPSPWFGVMICGMMDYSMSDCGNDGLRCNRFLYGINNMDLTQQLKQFFPREGTAVHPLALKDLIRQFPFSLLKAKDVFLNGTL